MTKHVKNPLQRLIAMLLCVVMVVGFMPVAAYAVPSDIDPENVAGSGASNEEIEAVYLPLTFRDAHIDGIFFEHDYAEYDKDTLGKTSYMADGTTLVNDAYDVNDVGTVESKLPNSGVPQYTDASVKKLANRIKAIIEGRIDIRGTVNSDHSDTANDSNIVKNLRTKFASNQNASTEAKSSGYNGSFASIANYYDAALWYLNNLWADGKIDANTPHMMKVEEFESLKLVRVTKADPAASQYHYGFSEYYYYEGQDANQAVADAEAHYTVFDTEQKLIYNTIADTCPDGAIDTYGTSGGQWWPMAATVEGSNKPYYTANDSGKLYFSTVGNGKFVYHKPQEGEEGLFFSFCGDDDVYLFINGKLVIDAGKRQNGIIAFVSLESPVLKYADSTTAPNGENNFTYKRTGVTDETTTWAEYLGLEDGGIYDFKFFHMERQNAQSKFSIYTNIKVVNPAALTQKFAYDQNGTLLPYGADVPNNVDVTYGLKLTNKGDSDVYYLSYNDPMLGVELDYNTCSLGNNTLDNLTLLRTAKNGAVTTSKVKANQELMDILKEGLKQGESLEIRGFTYNVGAPSEGTTKKVIKNTLSTSVIGVSTNSTSWVRISGTADMVVTTTAVPPKVFVIDYAKDLTLDKTDVFGTELNELKTPDDIYSKIDIDSISLVGATDNKMVGTYGTLTMSKNNPELIDWKLQYHLDKFLSGEDKFSLNLSLTRTLVDGTTKMAATVNKNVSFIPANNIYYEDDFTTVTDPEDTNAGRVGIEYSGKWSVETENSSGGNTESAEGQVGDVDGVHGWQESLADDTGYSDGSGHYADASVDSAATATFTFTGTGVDIYSRTNGKTGTVIATLKGKSDDGISVSKGIIVDNLAESGDYFQIPTLSFHSYKSNGEEVALPYGTYTVTIKVTTGADDDGDKVCDRFIYYLDGIRVYNPMKDQSGYAPEERNAIFKEVRDILLDVNSFGEVTEGETSVAGAVFIDSVHNDQAVDGTAADTPTTTTNVVGIYEDYGPKNEVYLKAGQSITFQVNPEGQYYYIGLKAPNIDGTGDAEAGYAGSATALVSNGQDNEGKEVNRKIEINHSTDLYYKVVPDAEGYIVIKNTGEGLLSVTKLRVTGETTEGAQVLSITEEEALEAVKLFSARPVVDTEEEPVDPNAPVEPEQPDVEIDNPTEPEQPGADSPAAALLRKMLKRLFTSLSGWFN